MHFKYSSGRRWRAKTASSTCEEHTEQRALECLYGTPTLNSNTYTVTAARQPREHPNPCYQRMIISTRSLLIDYNRKLETNEKVSRSVDYPVHQWQGTEQGLNT